MLVLTPSASSGPFTVSGAPAPIASSSTLVNQLSVKPRLGQWSKVLIGGPNLGTDESNAMAILYPVPNGGQADAFVIQDQGGQNTIDLSQIYVYATIPGDFSVLDPNGSNSIDVSQVYVYATIPGDAPLVDSFYYRTV